MKKRILSIAAALALILAFFHTGVVPARAAATLTATDSDTFLTALKNAADGDTIQVSGSFVVKNPVSNNDSLVIDKAVTITGGGLTFWYSGILLGANVTFKNITLGLASNMRNAILANGHTLTLENVQRDPTARYIHLFCGGQTGATQGDESNRIQGGHGQVILKGNTNLGLSNIYAGSISTDGTDNTFSKPATITIDRSFTGAPIEHIYASGALQTPTTENDWFDTKEIAPPTPSTTRFPVSRDVTINLYGSTTREVDGVTGGSSNAQVTYNDASGYSNDNLVLKSANGLDVQTGNLNLVSGSSLVSGAALTIDSGATLGLQNLGDAVTVGDFTGGGNLVLGQNQTLTVQGSVKNATTVAIGGLFNGHSLTVPTVDKTYIVEKTNTSTGGFTLAAYASRPDIELEKVDNAWKATGEHKSTKTIVDDFAMSSVVIEANSFLGSLPFKYVRYASNSYANLMRNVPLQIKVNNQPAQEDEDGYYQVSGMQLVPADDGTDEDLQIEMIDESAIPTGTYTIEVTVPAEYSGTGQPITRTATLTVKAASGDTAIPKPTAITGLVYTGQPQTGVLAGGGYTLDDKNTATNAGTHTATATLDTGFKWSDGSTGPVEIKWTIAQADNPNRPTGLGATAPSAFGASDGKITGTTAAMEYSKNADFSGTPTACTGNGITGLTAGVYYVRIAETTNYKAGEGVQVTVPEGPVTVVSVEISDDASYKTAYKTGEELDVTGLTLTVTMSDDETYTVPAAPGMVSGFNSDTAATRTLTVTYGGKTVTYTITVTGDPVSGGGSGGGSGGSSGGSGGGGGGSSGGGSSSGGDSGSSSTTTNPDGSVTTTVTDEKTGAVTTTTERPDGSTMVVETQRDGTVTITDTAKNGVKVEAVSKPETDTSARVSIPTGVKTAAAVTIPVAVTPGMVAVDAKTGELVKLSAPTEGGMAVKLDESADLILVDRSKPFSDTDGHWAEDAIDFATAHAMFNGTSETTFAPNDAMTRGMVAAVLHNFEDNPEFTAQNGFSDVEPGAWYADGVSWMIETGIAGGYGDGTFGVNDVVTREQLVTFLYRYAGSMGYNTDGDADLLGFADGDSVSSYAAEAMRWAVGSGLIVGGDGNTLSPGSSATRAQVATILYRFVVNLTL